MNEQIYIDLYGQAEELLSKHSASLLNERRAAALELFKQLGFPSAADEAYKYCRLGEHLGRDYGLNLNRLSIPLNPAELLKCDVPGIKAHRYYIVNEELYSGTDQKLTLPEGVILCRLSAACERYPDLVKAHLGSLIAEVCDGYAAFNEPFAQDGFFFSVPKGV